MNDLDLTIKLQRSIARILSRQEYFRSDLEITRNTFMEQFSEILKICFDLNITGEKLFEFMQTGNRSKTHSLYFASRLVDSSSSYIVINLFLAQFCLICIKDSNIPDKIWEILLTNGIDNNVFDRIIVQYNEYMNYRNGFCNSKIQSFSPS